MLLLRYTAILLCYSFRPGDPSIGGVMIKYPVDWNCEKEHHKTWTVSKFMYILSRGQWPQVITSLKCRQKCISLTATLMGPTWGPPGADRTLVGPMLTPLLTLLSGYVIGNVATPLMSMCSVPNLFHELHPMKHVHVFIRLFVLVISYFLVDLS